MLLWAEIAEANTLLGHWLVNLINIERRKALVFMNERSLLSFVVCGITQANTKDLGEVFSAGFNDLLAHENFGGELITKIFADYHAVEYTKTQSRSLLGNLNDLGHQYKILIPHHGGLNGCNLNEVIALVNRMPQSNLGWTYSIESFKKLIGN